ncbi:hypothetical protein C8R44DRAFT_846629 [Mycena epipterygia]|nr:hypothetical protein C8R44DRAFT_846629 [Mycena epipterygia]
MPKVKTPTASKTTQSSFFVLTDGKKRVLIPRPKTYQAVTAAARRYFPQIQAPFSLQTDELDVCGGELTDISPDIWEMAIEMLSSVLVKPEPAEPVPMNPSRIIPPVHVKQETSNTEPVAHDQSLTSDTAIKETVGDSHASVVVNYKNQTQTYRIKPTTPFSRLFPLVLRAFGLDDGCYSSYACKDWNFYCDGVRTYEEHTAAALGYDDGDALYIDLLPVLKGGKPVIYLFSPHVIDVSVRLTLTRDWDLSVIYPVVPAKRTPAGGESIQWDVRTHADGSLTEYTTGLDVAYLFWEALTNPGVPPSPPSSPVLGHPTPAYAFSPNTCDLSPADSVLLPVNIITPYLDSALGALGLHTEARTSFITYWLPAFLKHTHVALRFVPQAARLDITPAPDVITRVFMVFKGVPMDDAKRWSTSIEDPERWMAVVGVDIERAQDDSLFRVLEWGGMEVLGR